MIIGYARVSTTEQNLGLEHADLKPAFNASVDPTAWNSRGARSSQGHAQAAQRSGVNGSTGIARSKSSSRKSSRSRSGARSGSVRSLARS